MLDANPASITKLGKVTIHSSPKPGQNRIVVRGFSGNGTPCRSVKRAASRATRAAAKLTD